MANLILSIGLCFLVAHGLAGRGLPGHQPAVLALIACVFFVINTVLVSGVLSLLQGSPMKEVCQQWYLWSFPYYLIGAAVVGLLPALEPGCGAGVLADSLAATLFDSFLLWFVGPATP